MSPLSNKDRYDAKKMPSHSYRKQPDTKDQSNVSLGLKSKNHQYYQLHQKVTSFSI